MNPFHLVIIGSPDFTDYDRITRTMHSLADAELADKAITVITRGTVGAGDLGARFASEHDVGHVVMTERPDLVKIDGLLVYWDGMPGEIQDLVYIAKVVNKPVWLIEY